MSSSGILRKLCATDVPQAMELSAEAGWNQTAEDWHMLIDLAPESCLGIDVDGVLASTATLLCYGRRLAWVGMVLTRIAFRGRGFARRLLMDALTLADHMQVESVKLDATDQGQPLYEKLGFRAEQPVERWARTAAASLPAPAENESVSESTTTSWHAPDSAAFGLDRSQLLDRLVARNAPFTARNSYLLTRPGRLTRYLGPCIADSQATARALISRALSTPGQSDCSWDLLVESKAAVSLARDLGFVPKRHLLRMVRGKDLRGQEQSIFAIAGFELG